MGTNSYLFKKPLQAAVNEGQLNMGAWKVLAAVKNLIFKHNIVFSQWRDNSYWMMQRATCCHENREQP